jgi:hypothetical protein
MERLPRDVGSQSSLNPIDRVIVRRLVFAGLAVAVLAFVVAWKLAVALAVLVVVVIGYLRLTRDKEGL